MSVEQENKRSGQGISTDEMTAALRAVASSETLSGSPRLQEFLNYVVAETIAGRADRIRAKTIAQDVYARSPDDIENTDTVVRVEARRLRRLLADYYAGEGEADPVRLHVDSGGYVPRFERVTAGKAPDDVGEEPERGKRPIATMSIVAVGAAVVIVAVAALLFDTKPEPTSAVSGGSEERDRAQRRAIMDRSPAAVEAANMVDQARGLIYPAFDFNRQRLATELFRNAIAMDENSAAAHAGAAMTLATSALLLGSGEQHDAFLAEARPMMERALELDAPDAWVQSAAGWVSFVEGEHEAAIKFVERALDLAPSDGNILDTYGAVMLFSGRFEDAARASHPERERTGTAAQFADGNVYGGANFHLGNYALAAQSLEDNNESGGPISPPGLALLAASYHGLGRKREGQQLVERLEQDWPNFDVEKVFRRLHRDHNAAVDVTERLRELGWRKDS